MDYLANLFYPYHVTPGVGTRGVRDMVSYKPLPLHMPSIPLHPQMRGDPYGIPMGGTQGLSLGMPPTYVPLPRGGYGYVPPVPLPADQGWYNTPPVPQLPPATPRVPPSHTQQPPAHTAQPAQQQTSKPAAPPEWNTQFSSAPGPTGYNMLTPEQQYHQMKAKYSQYIGSTPGGDSWWQLGPHSYANAQAIRAPGSGYSDELRQEVADLTPQSILQRPAMGTGGYK